MRRTANFALWAVTVLLVAIIIPIAYIEGGCRANLPGYTPGLRYRSIVLPAERRPEAGSWLTYPEWHIVYSAESYARHLQKAPPSAYSFWGDVRGYWGSYCLVNRVTGDMRGAGDYKLMSYVIGFSFSAEMLIKALYENTIGRFSEWIGGPSGDDLYAANVQQRYADFMHDTPWYRYPFGATLKGLWKTESNGYFFRHWERRFALSAEYGVKAGYAKSIDVLTGATLGRDETTLTMVARASPGTLDSIDPRLRPIRFIPGVGTVVQAPRYAAFTGIVQRLVSRGVVISEIAGNDDIFLTVLMPRRLDTREGVILMSLPLGDRKDLRRIGVSTKVARLNLLLRDVRAQGGKLEHVYDY